MEINDPCVITFERVRLSEAIDKSDVRNGDLLLAYSLQANGKLRPDALILKIDPYGENDDEYLDFEGHRYIWEMDFFTLRDVKSSVAAQLEPYTENDMVLALQYFIENDAYIDFSR